MKKDNKNSRARIGLVAAALVGIGLTGTVRAQSEMWCELSGDQMIPRVTTTAGGFGIARVNGNATFDYDVYVHGVKDATNTHFHVGRPGLNGPILHILLGGPRLWRGTTPRNTQVATQLLQTGGLHYKVHSLSVKSGILRGQLTPRPNTFEGMLQGRQVSPATPSSGAGHVVLVANLDRTLDYRVNLSGMSSTSASLHIGLPGTNGSALFPLTGGPNGYAGTTTPISPTQYSQLQNGEFYVSVASGAYPGGELRAQLLSDGFAYGLGCTRNFMPVTLRSTGVPMEGGTLRMDVSGGRPLGSGVLVLSSALGSDYLLDCPALIDLSSIVAQVPVYLDAAGAGRITFGPLPNIPQSLDLFAQFLGFDEAMPQGIYTSNGYKMPLSDL